MFKRFKKATGFGWYKGQFDINLYIYESIQAGKEFGFAGLEGMTCEEVIYKMLTEENVGKYFEVIEKVELAKVKAEVKKENQKEEEVTDEDLDFELTEEEEADFGEEITEWYEEHVAEAELAKSVDKCLEVNVEPENILKTKKDIDEFFTKTGKKGTLVF